MHDVERVKLGSDLGLLPADSMMSSANMHTFGNSSPLSSKKGFSKIMSVIHEGTKPKCVQDLVETFELWLNNNYECLTIFRMTLHDDVNPPKSCLLL